MNPKYLPPTRNNPALGIMPQRVRRGAAAALTASAKVRTRTLVAMGPVRQLLGKSQRRSRWSSACHIRRKLGISLAQLIGDLTPYLIGWRGYFDFCQTPRVLTNLEAWIRRRLRSYLWRQWQNGPNRFKELRRRGVPKFNAAVAAGSPTGFWRMSGHPAVQQALRNHSFDSLGLPRLYVCAQA
jgi:hypothetical protein